MSFSSSNLPTQQAMSGKREAGVGRGGHRLEDLHYCSHCRIYFVNVNVYNIHRLTHSERFKRVCTFCNEPLGSPGELALHLLHEHFQSQHEETEEEEPSDSHDAAESSASKKPRRSDDPFAE